jgi:hypothetical protein
MRNAVDFSVSQSVTPAKVKKKQGLTLGNLLTGGVVFPLLLGGDEIL